MEMRFRDRVEAGRMLAEKLRAYAHRPDVIVLALPRGAERLAKILGSLDAAHIRRHNDNLFLLRQRDEMFNEQSLHFQLIRANPKGVLERGEVMHVQSHYAINAHRLEKSGDVA